MVKDVGRSPSGPGHEASPSAALSGASSRCRVPNADALVRLMSAWSSMPGAKFHAAYPFFGDDRERVIADYELMRDDRAALEATALLFSEYADEIYALAIEARRAATVGRGAKHESAVPKADAQNTSPNNSGDRDHD